MNSSTIAEAIAAAWGEAQTDPEVCRGVEMICWRSFRLLTFLPPRNVRPHATFYGLSESGIGVATFKFPRLLYAPGKTRTTRINVLVGVMWVM